MNFLKPTGKKYRIRWTGELVSCATFSRENRNRAPTLQRATGLAIRPLNLVGGSPFFAIFVGSPSRLERPYGTSGKGAGAVLAVVKRFEANMEVSSASLSNYKTEYTANMYMNFCDDLGLRRELTVQLKARYGGYTRRDTRSKWEFHSYTQTPASVYRGSIRATSTSLLAIMGLGGLQPIS